MINFSKFELDNGLRVIVHEDESTQMVAVNTLYNVGSIDESPTKTGFAHLFEHLMFGGSENVPDFDEPLQLVGGESNAFTNNDMTNYYDIVPSDNIETALWLEADRMRKLNINPKSLDVQQKVVIEEFKETCLNQPYGDAWHHISSMAFKSHPYRWPTIGLEPKHIEEAKLEDVQSFFNTFYNPNNAILVIAGNITLEDAKMLTQKWFGGIPKGKRNLRRIEPEATQNALQSKVIENGVPVNAMYFAFHMPGRMDKDYYSCDLISDILSNGRSSRFFVRLHKELQLFSSIDAFISGQIDTGLFVIEGKLMPGVNPKTAKEAIWKELNQLKTEPIENKELEKLKNKVEASLSFSECSILNKAINLAYFELLGDASIINKEALLYQQVSIEDIQRVSNLIFHESNCSELTYLVKE